MFPVKFLLFFMVLDGTVFLNSRILGETKEFRPEELWDHVWMVDLSLEHTKNNTKTSFHCVGALIHERVVLTSAMCLNRGIVKQQSHLRRSMREKRLSLTEYDSGSPVICRRFTNRKWVLIGFISKYARFVLDTERNIDDDYDDEGPEEKFVPIYTTIIPIGHGLTYEVIDRVMRTQYRVT
ncbi:Protein of unknown function [Cotesia congregata]|uniref:Peptidase S1 domain-containing protein n=1 Tax=Cotesia congregata TaxID=51543 RepID=A0A8J2EBX4_COTCN|nr:Protein of unknown function [Cotesia congregata]